MWKAALHTEKACGAVETVTGAAAGLGFGYGFISTVHIDQMAKNGGLFFFRIRLFFTSSY
jgi:hypothetical protein